MPMDLPHPEPDTVLQARLLDLGYEDVRIRVDGRQWLVAYADRRHADPRRSLREVATALQDLAEPESTWILAPMLLGQVPCAVATTAAEWRRARLDSSPPNWRTVGPVAVPPASDACEPSWGRADMSIYPTVRFNPYVITPLLRLEGSLPLAPGWWLEGRAQTPLDGGTPDPVRALLGWHKRDAGPWLATAWLASDGQPGLLGGTWRPHAGAEIGWDGWDGLLALRGRLGGEIVPAGRTETQAWGEVYLPGTGLTLKAGWGRFPLGDSAPFIGLRRTVPRGWLEVSAARSDTYGTRLALGVGLDLGPLPAKAPKPLRLRFPGAFSYTYAATGYVAASPLEPGSRLGDVRQRLAGIWLRETLDAPD